MSNKLNIYFFQGCKDDFRSLKTLIVIVLAIGVLFRFISIDKKIYGFDETYTSLRIAGYTESEVWKEIFNSTILNVEDLQKYQRLNPEKTAINTVKALAEEEPQHPPLYFLLGRLWTKWFGSSVAVKRSLSVLISLLIFPCIYWLCIELFNSSLSGWIGITLIAISPYHVLYAQEAREYVLWTVTILLSSCLLLQSMKQNKKKIWAVYTASLAIGLYTFPFTIFVMLGHGIHVFFIEGMRLTKKLYNYLFASFISLLIFIPWVVITVTNLSQIKKSMPWADDQIPVKAMIEGWGLSITRIFYDINLIGWHNICDRNHRWQFLPIPLLLFIIGYSIYYLVRYSPKRTWLFILSLTGITVLALALPDLILGGKRSLASRYFVPTYLGIELAVTYLISTKICKLSLEVRQKKLWNLIFIIILSIGILSCAISSQAETWWNKYNDPIHKVANIVNQSEHPFLINSDSVGTAFSLSYRVKQETEFWFSGTSTSKSPVNYFKTLEKFKDKYKDKYNDDLYSIFLVNPDENQLMNTRDNYRVKQIDASWCVPLWSGFWQVEKYQ